MKYLARVKALLAFSIIKYNSRKFHQNNQEIEEIADASKYTIYTTLVILLHESKQLQNRTC